MKIFTVEPHCNFTEDCLGEAEGSKVRGKIVIGLRVKYGMAFVPFPVAIVIYNLYGIIMQR